MRGGFRSACDLAKRDDFVFTGNPYTPLNSTSFESHTKEELDIGSHKRLATVLKEFTERGCYRMLTSHDTDFINQLYTDLDKVVVNVKRMISSSGKNRMGQEIIITSYQGYICSNGRKDHGNSKLSGTARDYRMLSRGTDTIEEFFFV